MRDMGIVDTEKALLPVSLPLKARPKEYHRSGNFAFFSVLFINFRCQNQYVNKGESLELVAPCWVLRLRVREVSDSWYFALYVKYCVWFQNFLSLLLKRSSWACKLLLLLLLSCINERFNLVNICLNCTFSHQQGQICWRCPLWPKKVLFSHHCLNCLQWMITAFVGGMVLMFQ